MDNRLIINRKDGNISLLYKYAPFDEPVSKIYTETQFCKLVAKFLYYYGEGRTETSRGKFSQKTKSCDKGNQEQPSAFSKEDRIFYDCRKDLYNYAIEQYLMKIEFQVPDKEIDSFKVNVLNDPEIKERKKIIWDSIANTVEAGKNILSKKDVKSDDWSALRDTIINNCRSNIIEGCAYFRQKIKDELNINIPKHITGEFDLDPRCKPCPIVDIHHGAVGKAYMRFFNALDMGISDFSAYNELLIELLKIMADEFDKIDLKT